MKYLPQLLNAVYYQFFFTNLALVPAAIHVEVVVEVAAEHPESGAYTSDTERESAFAIAHKAVHDAFDYDEGRFVASSHESFCPPNSVPGLAIETPTETFKSGAKVWVRIVS